MSDTTKSTLGIALSILMIAAGLLAIVVPPVAGIATIVIVGWLLIVGGVAHFAYAWHRRRFEKITWEILIGVVYVVTGFYLLWKPVIGLASLTLVLAVYLLVKAAFEFALAIFLRPLPAWRWILLAAIVTLVLAIMIGAQWPSSSAWAIGLLIGFNMIFSGFARLMVSTGSSLSGEPAITTT